MPSALSEVFSSLVPLRAGDEAKACPGRKYGGSLRSQSINRFIHIFTCHTTNIQVRSLKAVTFSQIFHIVMYTLLAWKDVYGF